LGLTLDWTVAHCHARKGYNPGHILGDRLF
jgi:hypothetical protein